MTQIAPGPFRLVELVAASADLPGEVNDFTSSLRLWEAPIHFVSLDGIGMAPVRRITEKLPQLHGRVDRGYRLDERYLTLTLYVEGEDMAHSARIVDRITSMFLPSWSPLGLRVTRDDGLVRQINCFVSSDVDFPQSERIGSSYRVIIPLIAPDPTWYDPSNGLVSATLINGANTFTIDVSDTTFGTFPIFQIIGPCDAGLTIESDLSAETISYTEAISSGHLRSLNLKSTFRGLETDSYSAQTQGFSISSNTVFREFAIPSQKEVRQILSNPSATSFDFTITAAGTSGSSSCKIYWYKRYLSL